MYQLMIIDDEPIVREGIKILLPWEKYGFEICAEGIDGKDGLNKVLEYQPDLVLVDIKMPGLSGLDLIKKAKEQGFNGKFIILTGHSDFEFAKSAISLGVRAYLLKPIDEDELIENIEGMVEELNAKKHLDAYYSKSELKAKKEFLRRLLLYTGEKEVLRREIKQYGLDFHHNKYCVAILSRKRKYADPTELTYDEAEDFGLDILGDVEKINLDERQVFIGKGYSYEQFEQVLKQYNDKIKNIQGDNLFITIGHNVTHWEDIHFSYECARMLIAYQFLVEEKGIITIKLLELNKIKDDDTVSDKLSSLIEIGDTNGMKEYLDSRKDYYQSQLYKETEAKVRITHNMMKVHDKFNMNYQKEKVTLPDVSDMLNMIKNGDTLETIIEGIYIYCIRISDAIGVASSDNVVKRMLSYMEKNYNSDLKLESIAKMFNYNSAYLGKIFKKYTGENFNNVLDSIRIKNAKRLLMDTDLKVYQVSEKVGYSNIDYFYSKFKKYVGISPKEFKSR
ncbi:MAG: two component transcriptional regulator, AraC family [Anaerocolumna sp.]|nr:two component transcriptional regulator, AraC family [Anaerocolumna sp.]